MSDHPTHSFPTNNRPATGLSGGDRTADLAGTTCPVCGTTPPASVPTYAGRYELVAEIARGGMGVIHRATDLAFGREVAVKVLQERFAPTSGAATRFLEEARITGQLQHPAIPPAHDVGLLPDGRPFLAMKLIKGDTLDELLTDRIDPAADRGRFVAIFEQICQAVAYAHTHKVIHRDLKPANVMVGGYGEVQVMDWGLAKVLPSRPRERAVVSAAEETVGTEIRSLRESDGAVTQAGSVLGTPAFMPPEQAAGDVETVDERADVFGLGAVLTVILTGRPPYVGKDSESVRVMAIRGQLSDALARLDSCGAEPGLVALCKRCLSFGPTDRPRHAGEVAKAVADLRAEAEDRARRAELDRVRVEGEHAATVARAAEQRKRRKVQLALAAALVLILCGAVAFGWWQDRQEIDRSLERERTENQQRTEDEKRQQGERERMTRNGEAVAALLTRCAEALRADDVAGAALALDQAERRTGEGGVEQLKDHLARCRADLQVLRELDRLNDVSWGTHEGSPGQFEKVVAGWRDAFTGFGIVPGTTRPEEAARRVNESHVKVRLLTALDQWFMGSRQVGLQSMKELLAILRAVDPDGFRGAVRDARVTGDSKRIGELAATPAAQEQPPQFAVILGNLDALPPGRRVEILRAAVRRRPGDFAALMRLGTQSATSDLTGAAEVWFRAALAVRPENVPAWVNLAMALQVKGDLREAIAAWREAILLDPRSVLAHNNLGVLLRVTGDLNGAIGCFTAAVRIDPKDPVPQNNLGDTLRDKGDLDGAIVAYRDALKSDPKSILIQKNLDLVLKLKLERDSKVAPLPREVKR